MGPIDKLIECEDRWVTDMGAFFPGERVVYRGKDLFKELKDSSWMALFMYGITGREFSDSQLKLFERIWTLSVSYPDPRLWNNRISALAGTVKSTYNLGVSAATAVTEATIYGHRANVRAIDFLVRTKEKLDNHVDLMVVVKNELKQFRGIFGFGRPLVSVDERIKPVMNMAKEMKLANGPHTKLAFEVEDILLNGRWRLRLNITGLAAALCADQGLSTREYYHYLAPAFLAGIVPCFIDSIGRHEGSFFPLRCSRIQYIGPSQRAW